MFEVKSKAGSSCVVPLEDGTACGGPAASSPFGLCPAHIALVLEWAGQEVGITDALPSACPACGSRTGVRYPSAWICAACEWRHGDMPDGSLPQPRVDVVYYIRFRNRIKIGTTANPRQRLARLWHDDVLAFERGDRLLERRRHEQFSGQRIERSEWFRTSPELERHVGELAAGVTDPWVRHARWLSEAVALRG